MGKFDVKQVFMHLLFALVMGVVAAFTSVVLCLCVDFCYHLMESHQWLIFLLPVFALLSLVIYRLFKLPFDMTTGKVVRYIRNDENVPALLAPGILLGTMLSTLGGASVGKEAGALHMGAALGDLVARPFKLRTTRHAVAELKQERNEGLLNQYLDDIAPLADGNPNQMFHEALTVEQQGARKIIDTIKALGHDPHNIETAIKVEPELQAQAATKEQVQAAMDGLGAKDAVAIADPANPSLDEFQASSSDAFAQPSDAPDGNAASDVGGASDDGITFDNGNASGGQPHTNPTAVNAPTNANEVRKTGMHGYGAACGMAATFSALFFSPIGSAIFVVELADFKLSVRKHFLSILIACFVAYAVASIFHIGDILPRPEIPVLSWIMVGQSVVIGVVCAVVGLLYSSGIDALQNWTKRLTDNYVIWLLVGSGITMALLLLCGWQAYAGSAAPLIEVAMHGGELPLGFAIKALLTLIALGFWLKGGEIMPTFVAGALLGATCTFLTGGDPGISAAIGVIAFFAAVIRCPLASIIMGCEIFGWTAFPYFAIAVIIATAIGRDFGLYGQGAVTAFRRLARDTRTNIMANRKAAKSGPAPIEESTPSDE